METTIIMERVMGIITIKQIFQFYLEGFKNMKAGKTLWGIIAIKFVLV